MPEACDRPCLLLKALAVRRIVGEELGPHLDCDVAIEGRMIRAMYGCHTASADSLDQPVRAHDGTFAQTHDTRYAQPLGLRKPSDSTSELVSPSMTPAWNTQMLGARRHASANKQFRHAMRPPSPSS